MNATGVTAGPAESNGRLLLSKWRDSLHVTCGLTACTPGSAPGPTLGNEYGKTLPFTLLSIESGLCHTPQQCTRDVLSTVLAFEPILCADIIGLHRHRMYTIDKRALAILIYKYSPDIAILYFSSLYSDILSCELILTDDDNRSAQCDGFCEYLSCHM